MGERISPDDGNCKSKGPSGAGKATWWSTSKVLPVTSPDAVGHIYWMGWFNNKLLLSCKHWQSIAHAHIHFLHNRIWYGIENQLRLLQCIKINKLKISAWFLRETATEIAVPLTFLCNFYCNQGLPEVMGSKAMPQLWST